MENVIMIGCDLHDKNLVLKIAMNREASRLKVVANTAAERRRFIAELLADATKHSVEEILFGYEASGLGYSLHDELEASGIDCRVLAPTKMPQSHKQKSQKNDANDAEAILEHLRNYKLAGARLAEVRVPTAQQRADQEIVRAREDLTRKQTRLKAQIRGLLKRNGIAKPADAGSGWTVKWRVFLAQLSKKGLSAGAQVALKTLLRQLQNVNEEIGVLDTELRKLAKTPRHCKQVKALTRLQGVGLVTALTFLTEIGDMTRFKNRRQVASYTGLSPSSRESGKITDRKGHITRQGPSRLRKALCQAAWSQVRSDPKEKECYEKLKAKNPGKTKIGLVAVMRRLVIKMWQVAKKAA
jgi:transposase